MIAILDYGLGNLGSIANMLKVIGEKSKITNYSDEIKISDGIILPGVGAFDAGMQRLNDTGLTEIIKDYAKSGKPILGICLGMQLLGKKSEEGNLSGLGLIPFECVRFDFPENSELKIPHMGWDIVDIKQKHALVNNLQGVQRYYFVHSYHAVCENTENVLMTCDYGYEFAASVANGNVMGVQFHPEKSHDFGLAFFKNFVTMCKGA
ncbi:MAG: imidazole glycerol phosphate synthase subunit HisH [Spirochaetaceae bacterium]|nr:imidazole glycerol phosphate synthase subunit HisH [Spirochaetaceae bacterium]